MLVSIAIF